MRWTLSLSILFLLLSDILASLPGRSDEGLWLFNSPPVERMQQRYGFSPSGIWLEHLQRSTVRFSNGGSGAFVSSDGLVITNYHVVFDAVNKLEDAAHNYTREGFLAKNQSQEHRCSGFELDVLVSTQDVTSLVNPAVHPPMSIEQTYTARRQAIATIERDSLRNTGLRSQVVALFQGATYQLYRSKRYTDIRLVFAPEEQIAFFGGDPDNFEYPHYGLDVAILRVYENGEPLQVSDYLKINPLGPVEHELVFVSGHPMSTLRQLTIAELTDLRDRELPHLLRILNRREVLLDSYSKRTPANAERSKDDLGTVRNSSKLCEGRLASLLDPQVFDSLRNRESRLRSALGNDPHFRPVLQEYDRVEESQLAIANHSLLFDLLEGNNRGPDAFNSELFAMARVLVRAAMERNKPDNQRLREFQESARASLELQLFSKEKIDSNLEQAKLSDSLTELATELGADHPLVRAVLGGQAPTRRAAELVHQTALKDLAFRRRLYENPGLTNSSIDPMISLARGIDQTARLARKINDEAEGVKHESHAQIEMARFAIEGRNGYPDATFTLRLAYGVVSGYEENGRAVPPFTRFSGLYRRAADQRERFPFDLPDRWVKRQRYLNADTPFNFVCDVDVVGGDSGGPVVNRQGEFVGIVFDVNSHALAADFTYTDKQARAIAVDSRAILQSLANVYRADGLVGTLSR